MISRGEIHFVSLDPVEGREQAGRRPVLVVSSDAINLQPLVVTVIVGTDGRHVARDYPTNIRIPADESGLAKETVFLAFQIRSLDPGRFMNPKTGRAQPAGCLSAARMNTVEEALRLTLSL